MSVDVEQFVQTIVSKLDIIILYSRMWQKTNKQIKIHLFLRDQCIFLFV